MIISVFKQIILLLLILSFGINFLKLFRLRIGFIERISSGFMLGIGFSTFGLFLLGFVGYKFNFQNLALFLFGANTLLIVVNVLLKNKYSLGHYSFSKLVKSLSLFEKMLIAGIGIFLLTSLVRNLYWPIWEWDAVSMYDYRAKMIAGGQNIFFPAQFFYDLSYPLLTSILHAIIYTMGGINSKFIYTLVFAALVMGTYSFTRRILNRKEALISAFLISFYPLFYQHSISALPNLVQSTFIVIGTFYLVKWFSDKKIANGVLASIFIAFSGFTRNEPVWVAIFIFLIIYNIFDKSLFKWRILFVIALFFLANYFVKYMNAGYLTIVGYGGAGYQGSLLNLTEDIWLLLTKVDPHLLSDSVLMFFNTVVKEMSVPILSTVVLLVLFPIRKASKARKIIYDLIIFCLFYLIFLAAGTLFYLITMPYTYFVSLGNSVSRLSIFWKILVLETSFLVIANFFKDLLKMTKYEK